MTRNHRIHCFFTNYHQNLNSHKTYWKLLSPVVSFGEEEEEEGGGGGEEGGGEMEEKKGEEEEKNEKEKKKE